MKGRKPKPTALKRLEGNRSKEAPTGLESLEPIPPIEDTLNPPPILKSKYAIEEWNRLAPSLQRIGLLTKNDTSLFTLYCKTWGDYWEADYRIRRNPEVSNGSQAFPNPWISKRDKALENIMKLAVQFGLSPSSRTRIAVETGEKKSKLDQWDDVLKGIDVRPLNVIQSTD